MKNAMHVTYSKTQNSKKTVIHYSREPPPPSPASPPSFLPPWLLPTPLPTPSFIRHLPRPSGPLPSLSPSLSLLPFPPPFPPPSPPSLHPFPPSTPLPSFPHSQLPLPIRPQFQKASQHNKSRSEQHRRTSVPPNALKLHLHFLHDNNVIICGPFPPRGGRNRIAEQCAKGGDCETHPDPGAVFGRVVGEVGDYAGGEGYHAAGDDAVGDG